MPLERQQPMTACSDQKDSSQQHQTATRKAATTNSREIATTNSREVATGNSRKAAATNNTQPAEKQQASGKSKNIQNP